jgi:hypothetical protein
MVQDGYRYAVDHRGIQRVLEPPHLAPEILQRHPPPGRTGPVALPWPPGDQRSLPCEPTTQAQRLAHALGPDHLWIRLRTYREDPTDAQARWRSLELLEVGFRPRRVAALLAIEPHGVYDWQRRFQADGLLGLSPRPRERTLISPRGSVQVMLDVLQLLDKNLLLGHDCVKRVLDALGYRDGHTTVWPMVALYQKAYPNPHHRSRRGLKNVPSPRPLPSKSGASMGGIWSSLRGTGLTASSCSTATVGPSWERAASPDKTSPAWCRAAARRWPGGARLWPPGGALCTTNAWCLACVREGWPVRVA